MEVWEIGHWNIPEEDIVSDKTVSLTFQFPISRTSDRDIGSGYRKGSTTQAKLLVIGTGSRARPSRRIVDRRCIDEVEGGHGRTLWTRRRIDDTRPRIVDPVSVLDPAHGSHRVTRKIDRRERDALRPGIRLFLESHPQKVVHLGSDFGLVGLQNTLA